MKSENIKLGDVVLLTYRLFAAVYGFIISKPIEVNVFGQNFDILWLFLLIYICLQILIIACFRNRSIKSIVGQLVDLTLVVGWNCINPQIDFYAVSFFILLLLCADNTNKLSLRLPIFIGLPVILSVLNHEYSLKILWPFSFFLLFAYINYKVFQIGREKQKIEEMIDDLFLKVGSKPYQLYQNLIQMLKKASYKIFIDDIYCFRWSKGHFYIVNGTKFVWSYKILESDVALKKIFESEVYQNFKIEIGGYKEDNLCFVVHPNMDECVYLYVLIYDRKSFIENYYVQRLLRQFFYRISRIQEADWNFKSQQIEELSALGKKMNYVNASMNTLHFIRNKLSPLKNYLAMYDDYINSDEIRQKKIKPFLDAELKNMRDSFRMINERADKLLEEQQNPFVYSSTKKYGLQQLFSEIKKVWQSYGLNEDNIVVSLQKKIEGKHKSVFYNIEGLILVLDNWISNIVEHGCQSYGLEIIEEDLDVLVLFSNLHKMKKHECEHLITIFNNNDRLEINKRNYHGLQVIKEVLTQMNIDSELCTIEDNLVLKIKLFKLVEDVKNEESTSDRG